MDELIKLVSEKTGIPEETARVAVDIVVDYIKERLPAPVASQIDSLLEGKGDASNLGGIAQGLGGLLGKR